MNRKPRPEEVMRDEVAVLDQEIVVDEEFAVGQLRGIFKREEALGRVTAMSLMVVFTDEGGTDHHCVTSSVIPLGSGPAEALGDVLVAIQGKIDAHSPDNPLNKANKLGKLLKKVALGHD